jgi:hypothetical protein
MRVHTPLSLCLDLAHPASSATAVRCGDGTREGSIRHAFVKQCRAELLVPYLAEIGQQITTPEQQTPNALDKY